MNGLRYEIVIKKKLEGVIAHIKDDINQRFLHFDMVVVSHSAQVIYKRSMVEKIQCVRCCQKCLCG
jgi:hypothetical protein